MKQAYIFNNLYNEYLPKYIKNNNQSRMYCTQCPFYAAFSLYYTWFVTEHEKKERVVIEPNLFILVFVQPR
jgi:hypothetical protein